MAESVDKTIVLPPQYITDAQGMLWSITPTATKGMVVVCNGVADTTGTSNVASLYYFGHEVYYKDTSGAWFVKRTAWQSTYDPTKPPPESADGFTVVTVGPAITSATGEKWTLSNTGAQPLQVAVNGTPDTSTALVVSLVYKDHKVHQSNSAGGWWYKTKSSDAWTATTDPTGTPVPPPTAKESADGTTVTTAGPEIVNSTGEKWSLSNTGAQPMQVAVNGVPDTTTALVMSLVYKGHLVYQSNSSGGWWSKSKSSDAWTTASDPTGTTPPPVTPPSGTVQPPPGAVSAGYNRLVYEDDFTTTTTIAKAQYDKSGYGWYFAQRNGQPANPNEWTVNTTATAAGITNGNNGGGYKPSPKGGILQIKTGLFPNANIISLPGWAMNAGQTGLPPMGTGHWKQCYMEAYIQYVPDQNAPSKVYTATGWPAFWAWAAEGISDYGFPGANLHTPDTIEVDFLEQFGYALWQNGSSNPLKVWTAGLINHGTGGQGGGGGGMGGGPIDSNWHCYGFRWVPGRLNMFFDDKQVGDFPLTAGATKLDNQSLFITIGTGPNWMMNLDYVRVWQK